MRFALLLILAIHGEGEAWKIDSGLTLEDCAARLESSRGRMKTGRAGILATMVCREEKTPPKIGNVRPGFTKKNENGTRPGRAETENPERKSPAGD